ncbi:hypothetical protein HOY82DRAFT_495434 [Tuber indicum]|nr:hypothetical protein HOY82DRAFT_495434 [Tuber indicum]
MSILRDSQQHTSTPRRSYNSLPTPVLNTLPLPHLRPPQAPTIPLNCSRSRNVSFDDATHPKVALGGFIQNGSITEANFLDILGIILVFDGSPLCVRARESSHIVSRTDQSLEAGVYDIYCDASIQVSDEPWIPRLIFHEMSTREDCFHNDTGNRDRRCVISGISIPETHIQAHRWTIFEAAHIFPPEHDVLGIRGNYGRWIPEMDDATESAKLNSVQNRLLLRADVRQLFNGYLISINPDDGYEVVVFDLDILGCDGKILDPACRNPDHPHHVSDQLLRWHYCQSVLANVSGVGEPIFEHDFPPGTDMVGEIRAGPYGKEIFELEIAARLRGVS